MQNSGTEGALCGHGPLLKQNANLLREIKIGEETQVFSFSAFVWPLMLSKSSRSLAVSCAKPGVKDTIQILKKKIVSYVQYGGAAEPQTAQDAPWLHGRGPSLNILVFARFSALDDRGPVLNLVLYFWPRQNQRMARARRRRAGFRKFP